MVECLPCRGLLCSSCGASLRLPHSAEEKTLYLTGVSISLLAGFGLEQDHNQECRHNGDGCGYLCAGSDLVYIYHSSKYRSIRIAIVVLSIQNTVLDVKLTHVLKKGISISSATARPVMTDEATFKLAINNFSSRISLLLL